MRTNTLLFALQRFLEDKQWLSYKDEEVLEAFCQLLLNACDLSVQEDFTFYEDLEKLMDQIKAFRQQQAKLKQVQTRDYDTDQYQEYPFATWFTAQKQEQIEAAIPILQDTQVRSGDRIKHYYYDRDHQYVEVKYLGTVRPQEVNLDNMQPARQERIRQWASEATLTRLYYNQKINLHYATIYLPRLYRRYRSNNHPPTFTVANGNNRIAVAKELGVEMVLCLVTEVIELIDPSSEESISGGS